MTSPPFHPVIQKCARCVPHFSVLPHISWERAGEHPPAHNPTTHWGFRGGCQPPRPPPPPATHYYTDPLKNLPIFLLFHLDTLALTFYGTLEEPVQKAYWSKTPLLLPERDQQIILVFCQITVFSLLLGS